MTENFNAWMQSVQSAVEKALSDLLPSENRFPEQLHKAMRYAVLDGGIDQFISAYLRWMSLGCPDKNAGADD